MELLAVCGSLSSSSTNHALLRALRDAASTRDEVRVFESLDDLPHFNPDRDGDPAAPSVARLRAAIRGADAVLLATPEYAGGMPGVLKNALDWLVGSGELYGKAVVVVSAAPSEERGRNARAWVEQTATMQGAIVCDSFTVAMRRGASEEDVATLATDTLERMRRAVPAATRDRTVA